MYHSAVNDDSAVGIVPVKPQLDAERNWPSQSRKHLTMTPLHASPPVTTATRTCSSSINNIYQQHLAEEQHSHRPSQDTVTLAVSTVIG